MDKIRVLLVDDHVILREGLRALLCLYDDLEVVGGAVDGAQALEALQQYPIDVVVMDMAMPGMGGLEATRRIVSLYPYVKILVLSQHDDERYVLPVCQAGASGYVLKRSASNELVAAIRTVYQGGSYLPSASAGKLLNALRNGSHSQMVDEDNRLTEREREILSLVAEGKTSEEISALLHISKKTVMCHRANIYKKLGTHKRLELIKFAHQYGLINFV